MTVRTRAELNGDADFHLPDNAGGLISPEDVRDRIKDLADSALLPEDIGTDPGNVLALDENGKLPPVDGSQLTNLPSSSGVVGTIMIKSGTPPAGHLRCDGSVYLQSAWPDLFGEIGLIDLYTTGIARTAGGSYTGDLNAIAVASGRAVAVGNSGGIQYTSDGTTWTKATAPGSYVGFLYAAIITPAGSFIAGGTVNDSVNIIRSTNGGVTWTKPTGLSTTQPVAGLAASSTAIVAVGNNNFGQVSTDDGASWSGVNPQLAGLQILGVIWIEALGIFLAFGASGGISTSSTGAAGSWTKRTPAGSYTGAFNAAAYDPVNGLIILVGANGEIQTSPNGSAWTRRLSLGADHFMAVATNGGGTLAIRSDGSVYRTENGTAWQVAEASGILSNMGLVRAGGGVIAYGFDGVSKPVVAQYYPKYDTQKYPITLGGSLSSAVNAAALLGNRVILVGSGGMIQTLDAGYNAASEFAVPKIVPPGTGAVPYIKATS